jgi:hypothetical protein
MQTRRRLMIVAAVFALAAAGCAEMPYGLEGAGHRYEQHQYDALTSPESALWNPTDWSLWMDTQGGGP